MLACGAAGAVEVSSISGDAVLEKRVMNLAQQLRCLVCQNQTLADSHADLAIDLKNQVREKLAQGMSDWEVVDFMVQRYGDFVLYRPPVKSTTWLLWFGPFAFLAVGLVALAWKVSRRRADTDAVPEADLQRAAAMLNEDGGGEQ